jgi:uncharacterized protein YkwD
MRRVLALLVVAAVLLAGSAYARPRGEGAPPTSAFRIAALPALQDELLAAINELRASKGLHALRISPVLSHTALGHSQSMAEHGFFDHAGFDGSPFWTRIKQKYRPLPGSRWRVGENMVWASPQLSAAQAITLWLNSPSHRRNLLAPGWREVGLGAVRAVEAPGVFRGLDVTILTADFGVR